MICELEKLLNRSICWDICMLHWNELPLKKLFCKIDGVTLGPNTYSGIIGKQLQDCENLEVKNFQQIFTDDMPVLDKHILNDLSVDQKYLYEIINSIQNGKCEAKIASKMPGKLSHSRFLLLACRICRLYVATEAPSNNLKLLTRFVVQVFGPMWFKIKRDSDIFNGPRHFFWYMKAIEWLPNAHKNIIRTVINNNSYFAHPENVLLSMLVDNQYNVRKKAVEIILRSRSETHEGVRTFKKPNLNYNASVYYEMVDFDNEEICEPSISKNLSDAELLACVNNSNNVIRQWLDGIPMHTQAVERAIKMVSETTTAVNGEEKRNGMVCSKIALKQVLKAENTKKNYIDFMKTDLFE